MLSRFERNFKKIVPRGWHGKLFIMDMPAQVKLYDILAPNKGNLINDLPRYKLLKRKLFRGPNCRKGFINLTADEIDNRLRNLFT